MKKILEFIKNYKFHIIMFIIILGLFIILKNIELTHECKHLYSCIPCPCTYDYVPGFLILKALKGHVIPDILKIYFIIETIRLVFYVGKTGGIKREIVYSLLILIAIYLFDYITNMFLNTSFV